MKPPLQQAYDALLKRFGKQLWWPADTRFEMMLGAILTQNTAWANVEKALSNLRQAEALKFDTLEGTSREQIAEWIRPAGYFNQKSGYIKTMTATIRNRFDGSLNKLFALDTPALRKELLSWKGVGPETADSILLYAGRRKVFVVDAYTRRVCSRHGWCEEKTSYDSAAKLFTDHLPEDAQLYNEYHALIVILCKEYCTPRPKCEGCPLQPFLR
jgi:endonuclease-3 related protein